MNVREAITATHKYLATKAINCSTGVLEGNGVLHFMNNFLIFRYLCNEENFAKGSLKCEPTSLMDELLLMGCAMKEKNSSSCVSDRQSSELSVTAATLRDI